MLRENLEMLEALGIPVHEVRSLGGAARSDLWLQIKADVCRKDLAVMECEEAAGLGTAMISFVGNGTYRSLSEASQHMVRMRRRVQHNPEAAGRYEAVYRRYQNLSRQTASLF
jgi:xylulokinase